MMKQTCSRLHLFLTLAAVVVVFGMLTMAAKPTFAQDVSPVTTPAPVREVTDDEVNAIANKLYCPVCENITLDTCGTAACADWRYEIRLQLESGMTEEQIVTDFVRRFGDRVVGTPQDPLLRAISLYTPWMIIAAVIVGAAVILVKRRAANVPVLNTAPSVDGAHTNRYQSMFEQDISNS